MIIIKLKYRYACIQSEQFQYMWKTNLKACGLKWIRYDLET